MELSLMIYFKRKYIFIRRGYCRFAPDDFGPIGFCRPLRCYLLPYDTFQKAVVKGQVTIDMRIGYHDAQHQKRCEEESEEAVAESQTHVFFFMRIIYVVDF